MVQIYVLFHSVDQKWALTPHGAFRLANPQAICSGRVHLIEYVPFGQWATIVAICL